MFSLFFALSYSSFLPYSVTNGIVYDVLSDKLFNKVIQGNENQVFLFIPENYESAEVYISVFAKLPTVFSSFVKFFVLTDKTAKKTFKKFDIQFPTVIFFTNGTITLTIPFPETEGELMAVVTNFLEPQHLKPIKTLEELYDSLGETSYTLITPPKLYDIAFQLMSTLASAYGPFSIKCAEPDLIKELGFKPYKLLIYRKVDKVLTEVNSSSESFDDIVLPKVYHHLTSNDIYGVQGEIALLVYGDKPTSAEKDLLVNLSKSYKFFFGSMPLEEAGIVYDIIGEIKKEPFFVIFDQFKFYYYPILEKYDLSSIEKLIDDVANQRIKPIYPSEEIPEKQGKYLTKVVGKNYEEFVSDEDNDVLMFYFNGEVNLDFPEYVASYLNATDIKFGYIDIAKNSCPMKFPELFSYPHIQLFPAYKKDLNSTYYGSRGIFSLLNFLRRNTRSKIDLDMSLLDRNFEISYLIDLFNEMNEFSEQAKAECVIYIQSTGKALGIGNTIQQITDALNKLQGNA